MSNTNIENRDVILHHKPDVDTPVKITVTDNNGVAGVCHCYDIYSFNTANNPAEYEEDGRHAATLIFQQGTYDTVGVNGITDEVLLAILIDRFERMQASAFNVDRQEALFHSRKALEALHRSSEFNVRKVW